MAADAPLADAVEQGDAHRARELLQAGTDPDAPQADGMTALHWAVYREDVALARMLLRSGAHPNAKNRYGVTPLSLACVNGNSRLVEGLLDAHADPDIALHGGETALMTAARTGRLAPVQALIAAGADVDARERKGQTALMWAAAEGHAPVVQTLIEAGADFKTPLESGFTPLFFAVREGQTEVVKLLLAKGLDVNQGFEPKKGGGTVPGRGTSPLLLAVENGHFDLALDLLRLGADPNDQRSGFTPLHALTWVRKADRGDNGDPEPQGSGNLTSLQFASALVECGAPVNARLERGSGGGAKLNMKGATPFLLAAKRADVPYMRLLLELGANPHLPNADGSTPLMAAAGLGTHAPTEEAGTEPEAAEAVKLLLELGADINAVDKNGETAMHGAAYKSLPLVVALLAENGADIALWNQPNMHGWTPLSIAEGYRPGNFKPAPATIEALHTVMRAAGVPLTAPKVKPKQTY